MSYEFCKPDYPEENAALANWVKEGGTLIYVGDGFDPFHKIQSFWTDKYPSAAEHLFEILGVESPKPDLQGIYKSGKGCIAVWNTSPSSFCWSKDNAEAWRNFFAKTIESMGYKWNRTNCISGKRGPYLVAATFDETENSSPFAKDGLFADMYDPTFKTLHKIELFPGQNGLFFDYSEIKDLNLRVIGTSARIFSLDELNKKISVECQAADQIKTNIRIKTPYPVKTENSEINCLCDNETQTVLISYSSDGKKKTINMIKNGEWK